jgi:putative tricarboxylic transport membrane protein
MMIIFERLLEFFIDVYQLTLVPSNVFLLFFCSLMGIFFGAMPGLTATLGVALLTTLTYGIPRETAMIALLAIYVGAVYGGSYSSILINIPGTAAAAATAIDGYPLACKGEAGRALGLTTTSSWIGTMFGMLVLVSVAPLIVMWALQFTSFEFFLLAFFGILISGTLTSHDLVYKGWISGLDVIACSLSPALPSGFQN